MLGGISSSTLRRGRVEGKTYVERKEKRNTGDRKKGERSGNER